VYPAWSCHFETACFPEESGQNKGNTKPGAPLGMPKLSVCFALVPKKGFANEGIVLQVAFFLALSYPFTETL